MLHPECCKRARRVRDGGRDQNQIPDTTNFGPGPHQDAWMESQAPARPRLRHLSLQHFDTKLVVPGPSSRCGLFTNPSTTPPASPGPHLGTFRVHVPGVSVDPCDALRSGAEPPARSRHQLRHSPSRRHESMRDRSPIPRCAVPTGAGLSTAGSCTRLRPGAQSTTAVLSRLEFVLRDGRPLATLLLCLCLR